MKNQRHAATGDPYFTRKDLLLDGLDVKTHNAAALALMCWYLMVPARVRARVDVMREARLPELKKTPSVSYGMRVADDWLEYHDASPPAGSHRPPVSPDNLEKECINAAAAGKCELGNAHCTDKLGCDFHYLLGPPQQGMYGVNADAPLWQWEILGTYGTASACEQKRIAMKKERVIPQAEEAWQTEAARAFCIAATDPRLPDMENERKWHKWWPFDQNNAPTMPPSGPPPELRPGRPSPLYPVTPPPAKQGLR